LFKAARPVHFRCKATLASLLRGVQAGLHLNEHFERCSEVVFRHACWMGLEGAEVNFTRARAIRAAARRVVPEESTS